MTFILKLKLALITDVPAISAFAWGSCFRAPYFRSPCGDVTKVCAAQGRRKKLPPLISQKKFLASSSYESMTIYLKWQSVEVTEKI